MDTFCGSMHSTLLIQASRKIMLFPKGSTLNGNGLDDNKSTLTGVQGTQGEVRCRWSWKRSVWKSGMVLYPLFFKVDWRMGMVESALDGKENVPPVAVSPPNVARERMDGCCLLDW